MTISYRAIAAFAVALSAPAATIANTVVELFDHGPYSIFTTPYALDYTFVLAGGGGGDYFNSGGASYAGGGGALTAATIHFDAGTSLKLILGARGPDGRYPQSKAGGAGGGGTALLNNSDGSVYLVAGGGGGAGSYGDG